MSSITSEESPFELVLEKLLELVGKYIFKALKTIKSEFEKTWYFNIVSEYLTVFYAICIISSRNRSYKPAIHGSNLFTFNYESSSNFSKALFRDGVEAGCQAFIISDEVFVEFLKDFHDVHDDCIQVFPNKHIVVYQSCDNVSLHESIVGWEQLAAAKGKAGSKPSWNIKLIWKLFIRSAEHFVHWVPGRASKL